MTDKQYTETNSSYHEDNGVCQKTGFSEMISKPEVNFWVPIIFTAVSIAISFMALSNQVSLQNQKLDTLIAGQNSIIEKYEAMEIKINLDERDITTLKSNQLLVMKKLEL